VIILHCRSAPREAGDDNERAQRMACLSLVRVSERILIDQQLEIIS
jgi:hypothetical protein